MRYLLLLLLIPTLAQAKECYFYPACQKKINFKKLLSEVPDQVRFSERDCETWQAFPFEPRTPAPRPAWIRQQDVPADLELQWSSPRVITVHDVPENRTCAQVKAFLQAHNTTETDKEEADRIKGVKENQKLIDRPIIQSILSRLDALEGN